MKKIFLSYKAKDLNNALKMAKFGISIFYVENEELAQNLKAKKENAFLILSSNTKKIDSMDAYIDAYKDSRPLFFEDTKIDSIQNLKNIKAKNPFIYRAAFASRVDLNLDSNEIFRNLILIKEFFKDSIIEVDASVGKNFLQKNLNLFDCLRVEENEIFEILELMQKMGLKIGSLKKDRKCDF